MQEQIERTASQQQPAEGTAPTEASVEPKTVTVFRGPGLNEMIGDLREDAITPTGRAVDGAEEVTILTERDVKGNFLTGWRITPATRGS